MVRWNEISVDFGKTDKLSYLAGYVLGDGSVTDEGVCISICRKKYKNIFDYLMDIISELNMNPRYCNYAETGGNEFIRFSSVQFTRWLSNNFKKLISLETLAGLLDSDGAVLLLHDYIAGKKHTSPTNPVQICFYNTDWELLTLVSKILDSLNIPYKIEDGTMGKIDETVYIKGCKATINKPQYTLSVITIPANYYLSKLLVGKMKKSYAVNRMAQFIESYESYYFDKKLPVIESFSSIQGEGKNAGVPQFFIRVRGCAKMCSICDSKYTWAGGKKGQIRRKEKLKNGKITQSQFRLESKASGNTKISEILRRVENSGKKSVCITGGMPTLYNYNIGALIAILKARGYKIHLETSSDKYYRSLFALSDVVNLDIKTPITNEESNLNLIEKLGEKDEITLVINDEKDLDFAQQVNKISRNYVSMVLQPCNIINKDDKEALMKKYSWIVDTVLNDKKYDFKNYRILPQLHVLIWGNKRGV